MRTWIFLALMLAAVQAFADFAPGTCSQTVQDTCLDETPCKVINGITACLSGAVLPANAVPLTATCWQYQAAFTCQSANTMNTCQPLLNQGCTQASSICTATDSSGKCITATYNFSCQKSPATTSQQTVCTAAPCPGGGTDCFKSTPPPSTDLTQAATMMEIARQAGVYGMTTGGVDFFSGYPDSCQIKTVGSAVIRSCCGSAALGQAINNHTTLVTALQREVNAGSPYVSDALFGPTDATLFQRGLRAMGNGANGITSTALNAFGFGFTFSASNGFQFTGFNASAFGLEIATKVINSLLACTSNEQLLTVKNSQGLCAYTGEQCVTYAHIGGIISTGICLKEERQYCCFNSILGKIINQQGRAQLGLPLSQCGGFSQAQMQSLDFSKMDFSEFTATIVPPKQDTGAMTQQVQQSVQQQVKNYYGQ